MSLEYIYLAIIVLFIASKIIHPIIKTRQLFLELGYKRIFVRGQSVIVRRLKPFDFIDQPHGFPMGIFEYQRGKTLFEKIAGEDEKKKETPEQIKKRIEMMKIICSKGIVYWPGGLKADDFFNDKVSLKIAELAFEITNKLLDYNFKYIKDVLKVDKTLVVHTAELCAKLGRKPHEHLAKSAKFTDLEAYLIDEFFYNTLLEKLNAEIERQNNARK